MESVVRSIASLAIAPVNRLAMLARVADNGVGKRKDNMKANRINLVLPVRMALIAAGISTVKVVNAVNAALGDLGGETTGAKLGAGRTLSKATEYAVSETVSTKYTGKLTDPLYFDAWHSRIEAANKVAEFETVGIPARFNPWLAKMKADKDEPVPAVAS